MVECKRKGRTLDMYALSKEQHRLKNGGRFKLFERNNRFLAKVDDYFFLSFFTIARIPKIKLATNEPKEIIRANAASMDKRHLLSLR